MSTRILIHLAAISALTYACFGSILHFLRFAADDITLVVFASLATTIAPLLVSAWYLQIIRTHCKRHVAVGGGVAVGVALTGALYGSLMGAVLGVTITSKDLWRILVHCVPLTVLGAALGFAAGAVVGCIAGGADYLSCRRCWRWSLVSASGAITPPLILNVILGRWPDEVLHVLSQIVLPALIGAGYVLVCVRETQQSPSTNSQREG